MNIPLKLAIWERGPQWRVAMEAGLSPVRLSQIVQRHVTPRPEEVQRLAEVLGVAPDLIAPQPATVEAVAS